MDAKRRVQQQFGAAAAAYVASGTFTAGPDLDWLAAIVAELPRRERALDVATGGGHTAGAVAPWFRRVVASDLTRPMLHAAHRALLAAGKPNVAPALADAEGLPFATASFDLVTCRIAPHHFPHPDRFIAEVARVLRRGGTFLLIERVVPPEPAVGEWLDRLDHLRDPSHVRILPVALWLDLIRRRGLTVLEHRVIPMRHELDDWLTRMNCSPRQVERVHEMIRTASPAVREAYRLEYAPGGTPLAFTDEKVLLQAEKIR